MMGERECFGENPDDLSSHLPTVNPGLSVHEDNTVPLEVLPVGSLASGTSGPGGGLQRLVAESFPYGAFAPNGSVVLESAHCWVNPPAGTEAPLNQFTGRSVWLAAKTSALMMVANLHAMTKWIKPCRSAPAGDYNLSPKE